MGERGPVRRRPGPALSASTAARERVPTRYNSFSHTRQNCSRILVSAPRLRQV